MPLQLGKSLCDLTQQTVLGSRSGSRGGTMSEPIKDDITILVVDDEPEVRQSTAMLLETLDYIVLEAADSRSAMATLSQGGSVDLLLTDVILPGGMDGTDLAREAASKWPGLKILLTSGRPDLVEAGDYPVIGKPFRLAELGDRIDEVLGDHGSG